jgi:hypothetical protein
MSWHKAVTPINGGGWDAGTSFVRASSWESWSCHCSSARNCRTLGETMYGITFSGALYLIIGAVVALTNGYAIHTFGQLLSFVLAILLWPLVLLGVNLHIAV